MRGPEVVRSLLEIEATFEKNLQILKDVKKTILDVKVNTDVIAHYKGECFLISLFLKVLYHSQKVVIDSWNMLYILVDYMADGPTLERMFFWQRQNSLH